MKRYCFAVSCSLDRFLGSFFRLIALKSGYVNDFTSKLSGQFADIDLIAVLINDIHHIDSYYHRNAKLCQLRGQIQVPFQIGTVYDI